MIKRLAIGTSCLVAMAFSGFASTPANDTATNPAYQADDSVSNDGDPTNNTNGWVTGDNGGIGFGAWTLSSSGSGGRYIGVTGNGGSGNKFGLFSPNNTDQSSADRPFTGALLAGQTFSLTLGATGVNTSNPGVVGLNLLDGTTPVFTFKFTGGGTLWQLNDGGSDFGATGIGFSPNTSISFAFTYKGGNTYDISITEGASTFSGTDFVATSTLTNITGVRLFSNSQGSGENIGFDNLAIVPEPSTLSLLAGPAVLGALFFLRRRRS